MARMHRCLIDHFGFDGTGICVLSDADPAAPLQPTGANIRRESACLVADARPGDSLFFHYSGHDTRLPAQTGQDDDTGYDECIVPCDMNLITGPRLHTVVLSTTKSKKQNKPAAFTHKTVMRKEFRKMAKAVKNQGEES